MQLERSWVSKTKVSVLSACNLHLHVLLTSIGIRLFPLSSASVLNLKRDTKQHSYNSSITGVSTSNLTHFYLLLVSSSIRAGTALSNTNQAPPPPSTLTSHPTLHYFSNYYESSEPYILHMQFQYETHVSALTLTSLLLHSSGTTRILCQFTVQHGRPSLSGTGKLRRVRHFCPAKQYAAATITRALQKCPFNCFSSGVFHYLAVHSNNSNSSTSLLLLFAPVTPQDLIYQS